MTKKKFEEQLIIYAETEPEYVKSLILSLVKDMGIILNPDLRKIVDEDFEEYDDVFKALA
jgi:hypothetical protein